MKTNFVRALGHIIVAISIIIVALFDLNWAIYWALFLAILIYIFERNENFSKYFLGDRKTFHAYTLPFSAGLVLIAFPFYISICSILLMSLADPLAGLMGRYYHKIKKTNPNKKTFFGSLTFFIIAALILGIFFGFYNFDIYLLALVFTLLEFVFIGKYDNYLIIIFALILYLFK